MKDFKVDDAQFNEIIVSNTENEVGRFESGDEISLAIIDEPGNYFIVSEGDTLSQFSVNIANQELYSETVDLNNLIEKYANLSIIEDISTLEGDLSTLKSAVSISAKL